jgi:hypothetical protein
MTDISKSSFDHNTFMERYRAWETEAASFMPGNKDRLFAALAEGGVTRVVVTFDGQGDSGQIEDVTAFEGDTEVALPKAPVEIITLHYGADAPNMEISPAADAVESLVYHLLSSTHGGWENNEGAYGEFVFDVEEGAIALEFNARFESSERYDHAW